MTCRATGEDYEDRSCRVAMCSLVNIPLDVFTGSKIPLKMSFEENMLVINVQFMPVFLLGLCNYDSVLAFY
jgi:hypothetical protein